MQADHRLHHDAAAHEAAGERAGREALAEGARRDEPGRGGAGDDVGEEQERLAPRGVRGPAPEVGGGQLGKVVGAHEGAVLGARCFGFGR